MKTGKQLEIHWLDAMTDHDDYKTIEKIKEKKAYQCPRKTIGFYLFEDSEYVVLCSDIITGRFQGFSGLLSIPKGMIKRKVWLK